MSNVDPCVVCRQRPAQAEFEIERQVITLGVTPTERLQRRTLRVCMRCAARVDAKPGLYWYRGTPV